jgi:hypothetical protein
VNVVEQLGKRSVDVLLRRALGDAFFSVAHGAGKFGVSDDFVPIRRPREGHDRPRAVHFLVRPEGPVDVILIEQLTILRDPLVGVLARFAHPDWHAMDFAKIHVLLDFPLLGRHPVLVKGVHHVRIERRAEDRKIRVPLRSAENHDVVFVHLAKDCDNSLVERLEPRVVFL